MRRSGVDEERGRKGGRLMKIHRKWRRMRRLGVNSYQRNKNVGKVSVTQ